MDAMASNDTGHVEEHVVKSNNRIHAFTLILHSVICTLTRISLCAHSMSQRARLTLRVRVWGLGFLNCLPVVKA